MKKALFLFPVVMVLVILSCSKNSSDFTPTCSGTKSFATDVNPIIQSTCAISGCHATNGNGPGALTNHTQVSNNQAAIRAAVINGTMPQNSTLSADQKNAIICWIDNGAPNN